MIDFSKVKEITIPQGKVKQIAIGGNVVWKKVAYTPLTAIWSIYNNNMAYYDTGYKPNDRTKIKFGCQYKAKQGERYRSGFICGEDTAWRNKGYSVFIRNPWRMITEWNNGNMGETAVPSLEEPREIEFYKSQLYVDGQLIGNGGGNPTFQTDRSLHLFTLTRNGRLQEQCQGFAIKDHFDIYEDDTPKMKLIPVLDKENIPCFYDTMSGTFIKPQGNISLLRYE